MSEYDIGKAFQAIEAELIASMMRNMKRHRAEETKEGLQWTMWQAEQLKALEKFKQNNARKYKKQFRQINREIETLLRQSRQTGQMQQEIKILQAIKRGWKGKGKNQSAAHTHLSAEFFKLNERKLEALIKATVSDMQKAETAVLRMTNDQYRKIIYNAQVYANTGAGTYEKAVDMATKDFLAAGINCIEYKNGSRHTISDYADMAIRTAQKRAYLQGEGEKRQEWGLHLVIVNKRGNPCPKCLPFVGKIMIDDVWSGGSRKDGHYPLISQAIERGLYHPRCRDSHTTYFPGITTADDIWTKEELESIGLKYQEEQKEQYAKRQAEKYGRLAKYSLDEENKRKYGARKKEWEDFAEFSPRRATNGEYGVNWEIVHSPEYRERIRTLTTNEKAVNAIETRAKWALNNRNGKNTEELYAISLDTGKEVANILNQQIAFGIERTALFTRRLNEADKKGERILLLHNHPRGLPPSISDLNVLLDNENVSGITVGHDGSIYNYSRPRKKIPYEDFKVALMKYSRYTEITGMERALEDLSEEYGFTFRKLN